MRRRVYKSRRAKEAEDAGLLPAYKAARALKVSKLFLQTWIEPSEWHHSGWGGKETDYYDVEKARKWLESDEGQEVVAEWDEHEERHRAHLPPRRGSPYWVDPKIIEARMRGNNHA